MYIRQATIQDAPTIIKLMRELATFEKLEHLFTNTEEKLKKSLFGASPKAQALVVEVDTCVIAYAVYFYTYSTFLGSPSLYLEDLYVTPEHRQKGIGTRILTKLAALAVKQGCERFEWSVLEWNQSAINVYTKLGADILPDWRIVRMSGDRLSDLANKH